VSFRSDSPCQVLRTDLSSFCEPFVCCLDPVVVCVSVVYHKGLFLWYTLGSDLVMLGRPGRMTPRRTPIRLQILSYRLIYLRCTDFVQLYIYSMASRILPYPTQTEQIHSDDQTLHKPTTDDSNYTTDETTQTEQIHSDDQTLHKPFRLLCSYCRLLLVCGGVGRRCVSARFV
jgi:hypothetical protein